MELTEVKIVADSSSDVLKLNKINYEVAPLKMIASFGEYVDDADLDVDGMIAEFDKHDEKIKTACPSEGDWLDAFGDAKYVFCITITSGLSGSYNSARLAKTEYENLYPDRKVCLIDSLSAGPELMLIIEKIEEWILEGKSFEEIEKSIAIYQKKTHLAFMLQSLKNLKNNGRVSGLVAKIAGVLDLRIVGVASEQGTLEPLSKPRGDKRALDALLKIFAERGYRGGKIYIRHCWNESLATRLKEKILEIYETAKVEIHKCRGLCSFYAEKGGLMIGFES
ncbi:MAG: DegV family protein [Clostridia bacterium]|nr:DegV family protein [Clostridia bacterium]